MIGCHKMNQTHKEIYMLRTPGGGTFSLMLINPTANSMHQTRSPCIMANIFLPKSGGMIFPFYNPHNLRELGTACYKASKRLERAQERERKTK